MKKYDKIKHVKEMSRERFPNVKSTKAIKSKKEQLQKESLLDDIEEEYKKLIK